MIAVNLVTGFLGVGKTTAIRHLLRHHPKTERWAVLVNEFGEIGVDGSLLDEEGVAIEEVAGGCLCCVAAPAFTVGLNRLIRTWRPQRVLIEPSGLGHPAQVLDTLRSPIYQQVLDVQATLCLMDARHLDSPRHLEHPTFVDQVHLADVLIANKADLYNDSHRRAFLDYAASLQPPKTDLLLVEHGRIAPSLLQQQTQPRQAAFPEAHAFLLSQQAGDAPAPSGGDWIHASGHSEGYHQLGWRIDPRHVFERAGLLLWLDKLRVERVKGLFHCENGWLSYNRSTDAARVESVGNHDASRLQLIDRHPIDWQDLDHELRRISSG